MREQIGIMVVKAGNYLDDIKAAGEQAAALLAQPGLDQLEVDDTEVVFTRIRPVLASTTNLQDWETTFVDVGDEVGGAVSAILPDGTTLIERYLDPHSPDSLDAVLFTGSSPAKEEQALSEHKVGTGHIATLGASDESLLLVVGTTGRQRIVELPSGTEYGPVPHDEVPVSAVIDGSGWTIYVMTLKGELLMKGLGGCT